MVFRNAKSGHLLALSCTFLLGAGLSLWLPFPALAKKDPCVGCHKKKDAAQNAPAPYDPVAELGLNRNQPLTGGTQNTTLQVGTEQTTLQVGTEQTTLQLGTEQTTLQATVEREGGPVNILFLIDSSQSMKEKIGGGEQKMDAAKRVLQQTVAQVPGEINIGLRVFGNGFNNDPLSDCQTSTLLVPVGRSNRRAIISQVRELRPYGLTPLTYGLMKAEEDLRYVNGPKTVILISDGAETCGGDPCAYIERLSRLGIKLRVDIVGLGLRRDRLAKDQLGCIAEKSGGKFYDANTAAELVDSITHSVRQALSGKVLTKMKPADSQQIIPGNTTPPPLAPRPAPQVSPDDLPADLK